MDSSCTLPFLMTASFINVIIISSLHLPFMAQLDRLVLLTAQIGGRVACMGIGDRHQ